MQQTDKVKPVYPPFNFVEAGGIIRWRGNDMNSTEHDQKLNMFGESNNEFNHQIWAQSNQWIYIYKTRQIWGIWKLRPAYSPETPNLGENRWCFVPCDLEIWWMTLENNRAPHLCCFKLCATFHSHRWIQTRVAVRKRPIWVKFNDF